MRYASGMHPEIDAEGISIVGYLAWFAEQEFSSYLDGMRRAWPFEAPADPPEAMLRYFFERGDPSLWLGESYVTHTGRVLFVDTHELLWRGFAALRDDPALCLMWRSQAPGAGWEPVDDKPPFLVVPRIDPSDRFVADKLRPLMHRLAEDRLDFNGRTHLVWVFPKETQQPAGVTDGDTSRPREPPLPRATADEIRLALDELYDEGVIATGFKPPPSPREAGQRGKRLLLERDRGVTATRVEQVAHEPRYAERQLKRGEHFKR